MNGSIESRLTNLQYVKQEMCTMLDPLHIYPYMMTWANYISIFVYYMFDFTKRRRWMAWCVSLRVYNNKLTDLLKSLIKKQLCNFQNHGNNVWWRKLCVIYLHANKWFFLLFIQLAIENRVKLMLVITELH